MRIRTRTEITKEDLPIAPSIMIAIGDIILRPLAVLRLTPIQTVITRFQSQQLTRETAGIIIIPVTAIHVTLLRTLVMMGEAHAAHPLLREVPIVLEVGLEAEAGNQYLSDC